MRTRKPATLDLIAAKAAGHTRYLGEVCPDCGSSERYVKTKICAPCHSLRTKRWAEENKERYSQMLSDWHRRTYIPKPRRVPTEQERYRTRRKWLEENRETFMKSHDKAQKKHAKLISENRKNNISNSKRIAKEMNEKLTTEQEKLHENKKAAGCTYCGSMVGIQTDHIVPVSRGGAHTLSNMQWLCSFHNAQKHAKTHDEYVAWCVKLGIPLALVFCPIET